MESNDKDKEFEVNFAVSGVSGGLKLKNVNSKICATISGIAIDSLNYFRWINAVKFLDKYNRKKAARELQGKETPLPPKFLIEILDNALQEDNEEIQEQWGNLIINWQDLEKGCDVKYMYIDLLKNLGVNEIRLLKLIKSDPGFEHARKNPHYYYDMNKVKQVLKLNDEDYELMILNLYRLKICDSLKSGKGGIMVGDLSVRADAGIEKFRLTVIGYNLLKGIEE